MEETSIRSQRWKKNKKEKNLLQREYFIQSYVNVPFLNTEEEGEGGEEEEERGGGGGARGTGGWGVGGWGSGGGQ